MAFVSPWGKGVRQVSYDSSHGRQKSTFLLGSENNNRGVLVLPVRDVTEDSKNLSIRCVGSGCKMVS